jgi:hypothetical protein
MPYNPSIGTDIELFISSSDYTPAIGTAIELFIGGNVLLNKSNKENYSISISKSNLNKFDIITTSANKSSIREKFSISISKSNSEIYNIINLAVKSNLNVFDIISTIANKSSIREKFNISVSKSNSESYSVLTPAVKSNLNKFDILITFPNKASLKHKFSIVISQSKKNKFNLDKEIIGKSIQEKFNYFDLNRFSNALFNNISYDVLDGVVINKSTNFKCNLNESIELSSSFIHHILDNDIIQNYNSFKYAIKSIGIRFIIDESDL